MIAQELEVLNKKLNSAGRHYILIGFGRWGSSDPWLGIPVNWGQISGARVIIEAMLPSMNVDLSQGSHFFHNLTSLGVGYFTVNTHAGDDQFNLDYLNKQEALDETDFVRHIRYNDPLLIDIDGKNTRGIICFP